MASNNVCQLVSELMRYHHVCHFIYFVGLFLVLLLALVLVWYSVRMA